jgi:hypothetical protein
LKEEPIQIENKNPEYDFGMNNSDNLKKQEKKVKIA